MKQLHILTVDCEEYFQPGAPCSQWDRFQQRVDYSTRLMLDLLDESRAMATFFVVGWVAERNQALVREIVNRGHAVACHSYWHRLVYELGVVEFREETRRARSVIEQTIGTPVRGYRAPSFSITPKSSWALEVLCEEGFVYDSSVFPVLHDIYGWRGAPRDPHVIETRAGCLWEFPPATFKLLGRWTLPVAGGGYLRILPMAYTRFGLRHAAKENRPLLIYCHPWELDTGQPRLPSSLRYRLRHYTGLRSMRDKLCALLECYSFIGIERYLEGLKHGSKVDGGSS